MKQMLALLKREILEHRTIWFIPLILVGIAVLVRLAMSFGSLSIDLSVPSQLQLDSQIDSKKLSEKKREKLYPEITKDPMILWKIAQASVEEIDEVNILKATYLAMSRAAEGVNPEHCLIDGNKVPDFAFPSTNLVKGDSKSYSIAAASILAKVARDHLMMEVAERFPQYHFHKHKGYGTKLHLEALQEHGPCPYHRLSFAPVAAARRP